MIENSHQVRFALASLTQEHDGPVILRPHGLNGGQQIACWIRYLKKFGGWSLGGAGFRRVGELDHGARDPLRAELRAKVQSKHASARVPALSTVSSMSVVKALFYSHWSIEMLAGLRHHAAFRPRPEEGLPIDRYAPDGRPARPSVTATQRFLAHGLNRADR